MRILYCGDVLPADTTSGSKLLHRHLRLLARTHEVAIAHWNEPDVPGVRWLPLKERPVMKRLLASRRQRHVEALDAIWGLRVATWQVHSALEKLSPDVTLTVAQGGLCQVAARAARIRRVPLVTFFHDWSPDWRENPGWARPWLDRTFRQLHRSSTTSLCVSEGMQRALGGRSDSIVLPPIPDPTQDAAADGHHAPHPHGLVYAGVLNGIYHDELKGLVNAWSESHPAIGLELYGPDPHWGGRAGSPGIVRDFMPMAQLAGRLRTAMALLVVMPFAPSLGRFARYSFPSKLVEYCAFGRPIIIWGPGDSSAADWARDSGAALVVDCPDPRAVVAAAEELGANPSRQAALANRALAWAGAEFSAIRIQGQFERALSSAPAELSSERSD